MMGKCVADKKLLLKTADH